MSYKYSNSSQLFPLLLMAVSAETALAFSPPASLPIEPASSDDEVLSKGEPVEIDIERPEPAPARKEEAAKALKETRPAPAAVRPEPARNRTLDERVEEIQRQIAGESPSSSRSSIAAGVEKRASRFSLSPDEPGAGDFSAQARMSLNADGFGGVLKLVQYPYSWLGVTETFRYFKTEDEEALYLDRRGVLVGMELHPWRSVFISPFVDLQGGWEMIERKQKLDDVKSAVFEAAAGIELRLTNFASIVAQWTEAYYPGLKEQILIPGDRRKNPRHYQTAEVLFNLKWEKKIF